jgi:hypothetical protein
MKAAPVVLAAALAAALGAVALPAPVRASQDSPPPPSKPDLSGLHAFDLREGRWTATNHVLTERLAGSHQWLDYRSTQTLWRVMDGYANVDENTFYKPGGTFRGTTLRAYDPKTGQWAIWWLDSRNPHAPLDPPVKGKFVNGVGLFYAADTLRGKPVKVRFTWSHITQGGAHWEQAYSADGGKTWETNWVTEFTRVK